MQDTKEGTRRVRAPQCSAPHLGLRCYHAEGKDWETETNHGSMDEQTHKQVRRNLLRSKNVGKFCFLQHWMMQEFELADAFVSAVLEPVDDPGTID